ncbi:MAG: 30S ribosomal protein S20 [Gammaproteobacteria bacterium]
MANSKQAAKRARQNDKRRLHNMAMRSKVRTYMKKVTAAIDAGDKDTASSAFKAAQPMIDGMVNKGILHKNKAARHKSRLLRSIKALA